MNFFQTFNERKDELFTALIEHIQISLISLFIAILIAVPLGIWLTRHQRIAEPIINVTAILQTIPSLALLGLMIPLFGIGTTPAIIALVIYALLPILRNTYTGIKEVEPSLLEAASGIGMNPFRRMTKVELPLAMPVIMAGVRTAMVLIIGTATLAAFIGAGGLGDLILLGIDRNMTSLILLGAIPAAILAIFFDLLLRFSAKLSYKKMAIMLSSVLFILVIIVVIPLLSGGGKTFKVSGKLGAEPEIINYMYQYVIEDSTDHKVEVSPGLGKTSFLYNALKKGDVDAYLEFTGTVLGEITKETPKSNDAKAVYEQARDSIKEKSKMELLEPMKYNNTYAVAVKRSFAKQHGIQTISDLESVKKDIKAGFTLEFNDRMDGYKGLKKLYGFELASVKTMEPKIRYQALENGDINLLDAYSTDAELKKYDLVILEDDKQLFPAYQGAPLLTEETVKKYPEVKEALNKLAGHITDEEMQKMNYDVQYNNKSAKVVAHDYLKKHNLIK